MNCLSNLKFKVIVHVNLNALKLLLSVRGKFAFEFNRVVFIVV